MRPRPTPPLTTRPPRRRPTITTSPRHMTRLAQRPQVLQRMILPPHNMIHMRSRTPTKLTPTTITRQHQTPTPPPITRQLTPPTRRRTIRPAHNKPPHKNPATHSQRNTQRGQHTRQTKPGQQTLHRSANTIVTQTRHMSTPSTTQPMHTLWKTTLKPVRFSVTYHACGVAGYPLGYSPPWCGERHGPGACGFGFGVVIVRTHGRARSFIARVLRR